MDEKVEDNKNQKEGWVVEEEFSREVKESSSKNKERKKKNRVISLPTHINFETFYSKASKFFILFPLFILILSLIFLGFKYISSKEIIQKDVSLTGGITLTVNYPKEFSILDIEKKLSKKFNDVTIRRLSDVSSGRTIGLIIESNTNDPDLFKKEVESVLGISLTDENSSIEFTGPLLSQSFFKQLIRAFIFAFIFIAAVVFLIFRVFVPSFIAVFSIFSDAIITLAILSFFNFRLSSVGIAAFLMLIGYSIDTDILLTARVLKRQEKDFYKRLWDAMKTGLTMTFASVLVVIISYFLLISPILKEIFLILTIGLLVDIMNTWMFNASLLKLYLEKRKNG